MDIQEIAKELGEIMGWDRNTALSKVAQEINHPRSRHTNVLGHIPAQAPEEVQAFIESTHDIRKQWRESVIEGLNKHCGETRTARLLDYGGGAGTDSLMFAKHCKHVTYFDTLGIMGEFASKRFAYHQMHVTQAAHIEAYQAEFDVVVSFNIFGYLPDPLAH